MLWRAFDKLIETHFRKAPDYARLDRLEGDVWARIRQSKSKAQGGILIFPAWGDTRLRYASLVLALAAGLMASQVSFGHSQNRAQSDTLGLEVFSVHAPYLITSTIYEPDPASS